MYFWERTGKNRPAAHTHTHLQGNCLNLNIFWYELHVWSRSLDDVWHIWHMLFFQFSDYCVKRKYKSRTRGTWYEVCWGPALMTPSPLNYVPVLSFQTMDVDIVSWLCIKSRMIGYTAQWPAYLTVGFISLSTRWNQRNPQVKYKSTQVSCLHPSRSEREPSFLIGENQRFHSEGHAHALTWTRARTLVCVTPLSAKDAMMTPQYIFTLNIVKPSCWLLYSCFNLVNNL